MATHIALLRGINVGGHRKLPMAELRASLEAAGHEDVATYIQSGNVALTVDETGGSSLAADLAALIDRDFGLADVPVVTRSAGQWAAAMAANPFPEAEATPKRLLVFFCSEPPGPEAVDAFDHRRYEPDRLAVIGSEVFVAYDEGMSKSKLDSAAVEQALGVTATARNWSTVTKLASMVGDR